MKKGKKNSRKECNYRRLHFPMRTLGKRFGIVRPTVCVKGRVEILRGKVKSL